MPKLPEKWKRKRAAFIKRHMAQVRKRREPLYKDGAPTRRHLALIAWAYSPGDKRNGSRKWIGRAVKRPGALRKKFARWYKLKPGSKIPRAMYVKGLRRAKKRGDTRTMRQINLAMTLGRMRRKAPRRRAIRGYFGPARRRLAANAVKRPTDPALRGAFCGALTTTHSARW